MFSYLALFAVLPFTSSTIIPSVDPRSVSYEATCRSIAKAISPSSAVFYPGSTGYTIDTEHYVPSSSESSACSVEPGSAQDVSRILKVLATTNTPFGIKSGGHTFIKGFSSTPGVQIAMSRINSTIYQSKTNTVELGPGQTWDQVYSKLEPHGVGVLGGRIVGVGVSGYLLGGGYSWHSNRYGLAIDSVVEFELVLPSGKIVHVSKNSYPDLLSGLKGGFNNFGIVTKFVVKAFPLGQVWGGLVTYGPEQLNATMIALADFAAHNTDKDAEAIASYISANGTTTLALMMFYNGPSPDRKAFEKFLTIPTTSNDASTRSFLSYVISVSQTLLNPTGLRGGTSSLPLAALSAPVIAQIVNQTDYYGRQSPFAKGSFLATAVEPFITSSIVRSDTSLTAYPHAKYTTPTALTWFWPDQGDDKAGIAALQDAVDAIKATAVADKQKLNDLVIYPNYAPGTAKLEELYGVNVPRLRALAAKFDPQRLMRHTGGFRF